MAGARLILNRDVRVFSSLALGGTEWHSALLLAAGSQMADTVHLYNLYNLLLRSFGQSAIAALPRTE
jgi:hypothetical protein